MWKSWGGSSSEAKPRWAVRGVPVLRGGDKKRDGSVTPHRERRCSTAKGGRERRTWLEEEGGQRARAREHERVLPGQRQEVSGRPVGAPRLTYPMACVCAVGGESRWCKHRTPGRGALTFGTRASHVEERCLERCVWRIVPGSRQAGAYRRPLEKAHAAGSVIGGDGGGCKLKGEAGGVHARGCARARRAADVLLECARACVQGSEHLNERRLVFNSPSGSMLSTRTQHAPSPARC